MELLLKKKNRLKCFFFWLSVRAKNIRRVKLMGFFAKKAI